MIYVPISELEVGNQYSQVFFLKRIHTGLSPKKQIPFIGLVLSDKSGELKVTLWERTEVPFKEKSFLKITGTVSSYNNEKLLVANYQSIMVVEQPKSTEDYFSLSLDSLTLKRLNDELIKLTPQEPLFKKIVQAGLSSLNLGTSRIDGKEFAYDGSLLDFLVTNLRCAETHHESINDQQYQFNKAIAKFYICIDLLFKSPFDVCLIDNSKELIALLQSDCKEKYYAQSIITINKTLAKYTFALKYKNIG